MFNIEFGVWYLVVVDSRYHMGPVDLVWSVCDDEVQGVLLSDAFVR